MDLGRYSSSLGKYMTFKHYMLAHSWRCMGHRLERHNIIVLTFGQRVYCERIGRGVTGQHDTLKQCWRDVGPPSATLV